jgi:hypothetical protein
VRHEIPTDIAVLFGVLLVASARAYILGRVHMLDERGCWTWACGGDGRYGHAYFMGQRFKAHRLAYLAFVGRIPRGRVVDHRECDNPPCCCPTHLQAVTQSHNIKRCFSVGRGRSPFLKEKCCEE